MRKSSLGRRSSTHIPVRVPSIGGSTSRTCSEKKKSTGTLLRPGFSIGRRSQSADRESGADFLGVGRLQRTSSMSSMTPITPRPMSLHGNLPTGSARAPKNQMASTDSARRMSSFGGGGKRKDTRPITEKSFQQAAQVKVQEYFNMHAPDVVGPGNSIRPMNMKLFVDMMNHLLGNLDARIVISKSNYLDELPPLLRKLGYRSKVDRSWLMTVNTPHSWQHVIAVLSWLVDLKEIMDLTEPFEIMYPNMNDQTEEEEEDEEDALVIDRDTVNHLKKAFQIGNDEERLKYMDEEFFEKQIRDLKCTDEDLEILQKQNDLIREEVDSEIQRKNVLSEELERIKERQQAAIEDCESMKAYIEQSKNFVETVDVKLGTTNKEILLKRAALDKKKEELQKIQDKVNTQQISLDEIEKCNAEKNNLQRMIMFYENTIREYQNSAFNVDMKYAEDQKKLEKLVLEYNKIVAEKVVLEPQLKDCEIKLQLLTDISSLKMIGSNLKKLKEEYKSSILELESKKEECESILKKANEDVEITKEEIDKETTLLEGIERDYEKQKELATKETEKLKDKLSHCQKMSQDISEELSQSDSVKLDEKKQKLKMLEHDYELVRKKSKRVLEGTVEIIKENLNKISETPSVIAFAENLERIAKEI